MWARNRTACMLAGIVGVLAAAPAPASAGPPCKGRDVLRSNDVIKVVDQRGRHGHRYIACVDYEYEPARVVLKGSRPGGKLDLLDSTGGHLAVRDRRSGAVHVWDIGSYGKHRRLRRHGRDPVGRVLVTTAGEAAALYPDGGGFRLVGYDFDGAPYTLDTGAIAPGSLKHDRDTGGIGWSKAGVPRTARLDEPGVPCAKTGGRRVRDGGAIRITRFEFSDEYFLGQLTGTTTRFRACARGGPLRLLGEYRVVDDYELSEKFELRAVKGPFVLTWTSESESSGDTEEAYTLHDVATGRRTELHRAWDSDDTQLLGIPRITSNGLAAVAVTSEEGEALWGFDANGHEHLLDSATGKGVIDAASLRFSGTVLGWTHGGEPRSADLAALPAPVPAG